MATEEAQERRTARTEHHRRTAESDGGKRQRCKGQAPQEDSEKWLGQGTGERERVARESRGSTATTEQGKETGEGQKSEATLSWDQGLENSTQGSLFSGFTAYQVASMRCVREYSNRSGAALSSSEVDEPPLLPLRVTPAAR